MRRKLGSVFIAIFLLAVSLAAVLTGCSPKISDFSVTLPKTVYAVDEPLDPDGAGKLNVVYRNGGTALVNLKQAEIEGFDTATSGEKTMTVAYRGMKKSVGYTVSGNVETRARLRLGRGAGAECVVSIESVEFPVYAVAFTVTEGKDLFPNDPEVRTKGWKCRTKVKENSISVLLYTDSGKPIVENSTLINFLTSEDAEFTLTAISIASDGDEYVLPDAVLKNPLPES